MAFQELLRKYPKERAQAVLILFASPEGEVDKSSIRKEDLESRVAYDGSTLTVHPRKKKSKKVHDDSSYIGLQQQNILDYDSTGANIQCHNIFESLKWDKSEQHAHHLNLQQRRFLQQRIFHLVTKINSLYGNVGQPGPIFYFNRPLSSKSELCSLYAIADAFVGMHLRDDLDHNLPFEYVLAKQIRGQSASVILSGKDQ